MTDYESFIASKSRSVDAEPIAFGELAGHLFPHQKDIVRWALRRGRAAVFADTGLGKGPMLLEWSRHASEHGRVLALAPLAVAQQLVREAEKFGVPGVGYLRKDDGSTRIAVTNYEMVEHFDARNFVAVVLDESSILKAFDGKTRNLIIETFRDTRWRLACTATPAPNDHTELGNHSEFLGIKSRTEMLAEYFCHDGGETQVWRLKGHARRAFWEWVGKWGCVLRKPSDLGHDDAMFALPPLRMHEHVVNVDIGMAREAGFLFTQEASTLNDQRKIRRASLAARVGEAASIANADDSPVIVWCELNDESSALAEAIDGAVEIVGSDPVDQKTEKLVGFTEGKFRVCVTKPSVAGFGLNWQHAARQVFVGVSHSYEQTYQAIRRSWRFGQKRPVDVHIVRTDADGAIMANLKRKEADAERMGAEMVSQMGDIVRAEITGTRREWNEYDARQPIILPQWIEEAAQ